MAETLQHTILKCGDLSQCSHSLWKQLFFSTCEPSNTNRILKNETQKSFRERSCDAKIITIISNNFIKKREEHNAGGFSGLLVEPFLKLTLPAPHLSKTKSSMFPHAGKTFRSLGDRKICGEKDKQFIYR